MNNVEEFGCHKKDCERCKKAEEEYNQRLEKLREYQAKIPFAWI